MHTIYTIVNTGSSVFDFFVLLANKDKMVKNN